MQTSDKDRKAWAAKTVAILYTNDKMRGEFMTAYHSGASPDVIKAFLTDRIGMPDDVASDIVTKQDQELSDYIGKLVCDYLW